MDEDLATEVRELLERVTRFLDEFEEYAPLLRAYLDPEQSGPRGYFMRKRMAATNGRHDG